MSVTHKLSKYPEFLKPYVISSICIRCAIKKKNLIETIVSVYRFIAPWITEHKRSIERATKHLKPVFEERFRMYEKYGDNWPDKPVCRIVPPSIPLPPLFFFLDIFTMISNYFFGFFDLCCCQVGTNPRPILKRTI